ECHGIGIFVLELEGQHFLAATRVPEPQRTVVAGRNQSSRIRGKGQAPDWAAMTLENQYQRAIVWVPDAREPIEAARGQPLAVPAIRQAEVAFDRLELRAGRGVPDSHFAIGASCRHVPAAGTEGRLSHSRDGTFGRQLPSAGGCIPDAHGRLKRLLLQIVHARCDQSHAVRAEGPRFAPLGVGFEVQDFPAADGVPDGHPAIKFHGSESVAVGAEREAENIPTGTAKGPNRLAACWVPNRDLAVQRAGCQVFPVRTEGEIANAGSMPLHYGHVLPSNRIPYPDRAIRASRNQALAVRAEGHARHF